MAPPGIEPERLPMHDVGARVFTTRLSQISGPGKLSLHAGFERMGVRLWQARFWALVDGFGLSHGLGLYAAQLQTTTKFKGQLLANTVFVVLLVRRVNNCIKQLAPCANTLVSPYWRCLLAEL